MSHGPEPPAVLSALRALFAERGVDSHLVLDQKLGNYLRVSLPAGESSRDVSISEDEATRVGIEKLAKWSSLDRYNGFWNRADGVIEVSLLDRYYGPGIREHLMSMPSELIAVGDSGPSLQVKSEELGAEIVLGRASAEFDVLDSPPSSPSQSAGTLRLSGVRLTTADEAETVAKRVFDAFSFELDLATGLVIAPRSRHKGAATRTPGKLESPALGFPASQYDHAPLLLYFEGRSPRSSPAIRYLMLYQVLEYYFRRHVRAEVIPAFGEIVKTAAFNPHDDDDLKRLVDVALKLGGRWRDEQRQLTATLERITDNAEVAARIVALGLEKQLLDSSLSEMTVNVEEESTVVKKLSKRVYDVRNRIAHSKSVSDKEDGPGLLPRGETEDEVFRELGLIEFLAQKAIQEARTDLDVPVIDPKSK